MEELLLGKVDECVDDEIIKEFLEQRKLIINDEIDKNIIENCIAYILKWNSDDKDKPADKRDVITIYINSDGGEVINGFNLIDIIESSITPIRTVCLGCAASMAFSIFISAKKRYAFKNSVLHFHDGETGVRSSTGKFFDTVTFNKNLEDRSKEHILTHTNISKDFYKEVYRQECYMFANDKGKELGCVDYIIGDNCTIDEIL